MFKVNIFIILYIISSILLLIFLKNGRKIDALRLDSLYFCLLILNII